MKVLLDLKAKYKELTGQDVPGAGGKGKKDKKEKKKEEKKDSKPAGKPDAKSATPAITDATAGPKKQTG